MAATLGLVLDCDDPDKLAEFWSAAIGYATLGGAGNYVMLVDADGKQPKLLLQRVDEPKSGKNRMHFDIETPPSTRRSPGLRRSARDGSWTTPSKNTATGGSSWPTPKATSSACATRGHTSRDEGSVVRGLFCMEAGAQQVERLDRVARVGVGLLLDDVPTISDVEGRRAYSQSPRQMQPSANFADRGIDQLELLCIAEPRAEYAAYGVGALPVHRARRQHRPELHIRRERGGERREVAVRERFEKHPSYRPAGHRLRILRG
ncbi:MAG: hypothetical protein QOE91_1225 [Gaiellaceae bacterium]|nr:hypothetical protein [Gaiellaceae bacterium]